MLLEDDYAEPERVRGLPTGCVRAHLRLIRMTASKLLEDLFLKKPQRTEFLVQNSAILVDLKSGHFFS